MNACANVVPLLLVFVISVVANACQFVAGGWLLRRVLELMKQLNARKGPRVEAAGGRSTVGPPQLSHENLLASYVLARREGGSDLNALEAEVLRRMYGEA